jgi:hypothetical protein
MTEGSGVIQGVFRITDGRHHEKYFLVTRSDKEDQKMHMISRLGFASLALGFAVLAAPAARADGSEGTGLQAVTEVMRQDAVRDNHAGWRNGEAKFAGSGTGSPGLIYSGNPQGSVGRLGVASFVGNGGGNPIVAYAPEPAANSMVAQKR